MFWYLDREERDRYICIHLATYSELDIGIYYLEYPEDEPPLGQDCDISRTVNSRWIQIRTLVGEALGDVAPVKAV